MTAVFRGLAWGALALTLAASAQSPAAPAQPDRPVTLVFAGDTTLDDDAGA